MARKFILQGITKSNHLDEIRDVLTVQNPSRILIGTAFLNHRGFSLVKDILVSGADKTTIFVGIRNGITSDQGIRACLESGCKIYVVDTGSRMTIFHPKIYLCKSIDEARIIIGSANLTRGGLYSNIEASMKIVADLKLSEEAALVDDIERKLDGMIARFPDHVAEITTPDQVKSLLDSGLLIDERIKPAPSPSTSSTNRDHDSIPQMNLETKQAMPDPFIPTPQDAESITAINTHSSSSPATSVIDQSGLVWVSKPLQRRALNIPSAATTNPTGSMGFTKGRLHPIDQRHYFRDVVFKDLNWEYDTTPGRGHLERAEAEFLVVIKNVNYGVYVMSLTHDSRTDSRAYRQHNITTHLHWGNVKPLVSREDLLGRTMFLYLTTLGSGRFVLEID